MNTCFSRMDVMLGGGYEIVDISRETSRRGALIAAYADRVLTT